MAPLMTPLCVHLDPNYSTVTWTADGTHRDTHAHRRSGHGNRLIMVVLVCSGITWPNLLSTTSIYLI